MQLSREFKEKQGNFQFAKPHPIHTIYETSTYLYSFPTINYMTPNISPSPGMIPIPIPTNGCLPTPRQKPRITTRRRPSIINLHHNIRLYRNTPIPQALHLMSLPLPIPIPITLRQPTQRPLRDIPLPLLGLFVLLPLRRCRGGGCGRVHPPSFVAVMLFF